MLNFGGLFHPFLIKNLAFRLQIRNQRKKVHLKHLLTIVQEEVGSTSKFKMATKMLSEIPRHSCPL
jgi:hypothetical protein